MKKIISFGLLLAMVITGCKKEPESEYELRKIDNSGTMTATLNGKPWMGHIIHTSINENSPGRIYIMGNVYVNGMNRAALGIDNIALHNDTQRIYNFIRWTVFEQTGYRPGPDTCVGSYSTGEYDVVENTYGVVEEEENFIKLDGYNPSSPAVKGSFQLTFFRIRASTKPQTQGLPDTLRFTDGRIDVQIMTYD